MEKPNPTVYWEDDSLENLVTSTLDPYSGPPQTMVSHLIWQWELIQAGFGQEGVPAAGRDPAFWNLKGYEFPSPPDWGPRIRSKSEAWLGIKREGRK